MKSFIITLFVVLILPIYGYSQTLVQTFIDPCTKLVSTFVIPVSGFTTVVFYNKSRTFTASDVQSGIFQTWINEVYEDYRKLSPCSVSSALSTTTQITANAVSAAVAGAVSSATSSAASSAAASAASSAAAAGAPSSSSSSSSESSSSSSESSSSESSSSEKSSSKSSSSSSKSSSKSGAKKDSKSSKAAAKVNPILFNSDLTAGQTGMNSINMILSTGISQTSMAGDVSYGASAMIFSNLKQFVLSGRYTKMNLNEGKLESISNYGGTVALMYGNLFGFMTYAYIYPMGKYGVTGANLTVSIASAPYLEDRKQYSVSHSLLLFYTRPFIINRRLTLSPDVYMSGSPVTYMSREKLFVVSQDMGFITGVGADYNLSKRFKINTGIRTSLSTNPDIPVLFFIVIGSKVNL